MRLAIWPTTWQPYSDILETARHAEATGWDGVYIADHFMANAGGPVPEDQPTLEGASVLAALGAAVPRLRIGSLVFGNTYRHPAVLAKMAATIDHVTSGRFTLGVGAGWQVNEHQQYGIELPPVRQRLDRFEEALRVLHGLLRQPRTTVDGEYYRVTEAVCEPKPIQDPLPILVGGGGERRMLRIAARYADVWNTWGRPDLIARKSALLSAYCSEIGRDPTAIARTAQALVVVDGPVPEMPMPVIGGSVPELAETLAEYREIGLDELIVPDGLLRLGGDRLTAMDTIRGLANG